MSDVPVKSTERYSRKLHPLPLRIMHWINALAIIIMIGSGWKIYNDEVLFGWLHFPDWITIGGEAQGALQWHFFAMWILMINGLFYLGYGIVTRPLPPQAVSDPSARNRRQHRRRIAVPPRARRHHPL